MSKEQTDSIEAKRKLQADAGIPHLPTDLTYECRLAVAGEGPRAYDWSDKPHRLVYDLCRAVEALSAVPAEAQAVAWQWRRTNHAPWRLWEGVPPPWFSEEGYEFRPLYASPSPAGGVQAVDAGILADARYMVGNPSAWDSYDERASEVIRALLAALSSQAQTTGGVERRQVDDDMEVLRRLADGDTIVFSQDGDYAWFTKGDRAFVGDAVIRLREKGLTERRCDDEENYRGMSEYDAISEAGRAALKSGAPDA